MHRAKTRAVLVLFMTKNLNAKLLFEIFHEGEKDFE